MWGREEREALFIYKLGPQGMTGLGASLRAGGRTRPDSQRLSSCLRPCFIIARRRPEAWPQRATAPGSQLGHRRRRRPAPAAAVPGLAISETERVRPHSRTQQRAAAANHRTDMRLVLFLALACAARAGARAPRVRAGRPPQACGDCTGIAAPAVVQFSAATGAAGKPLAAGCLCLHDAPDEAMHALNEQAVKASSQEGDVPCVSARAGSLVPVITGFHGNLGIYKLPTDKEPAARVLLSQLVAAELLDVKSNTLRKTCGTSKQRACRVWRAAAASDGLCAVLALAGGSGSNTAAETALGSLSPSFPFKGRGRRGERNQEGRPRRATEIPVCGSQAYTRRNRAFGQDAAEYG